MYAAKDYITNVDSHDVIAVRDKLLKTPNMNTTGRLPAVLLLHLDMRVRITLSDECLAAHAPVDTVGVGSSGALCGECVVSARTCGWACTATESFRCRGGRGAPGVARIRQVGRARR